MLLEVPIEINHLIVANLPKRELIALGATCRFFNLVCNEYVTKALVEEMKRNVPSPSYLHKAIQHSRHEHLQRLLLFQPPLNNLDTWGETAVHIAVRRNCQFCVQLLLSAGADPHLATSQCWTPLMLASRYGHRSIVQEFLNAGVDVNKQGFHGWSALHLAIAYRHADIVRDLVHAGADQGIADNDGIKAKAATCMHNCWGVVGANPIPIG